MCIEKNVMYQLIVVTLLPSSSKLNTELLTVILRKAAQLDMTSKKKKEKKDNFKKWSVIILQP